MLAVSLSACSSIDLRSAVALGNTGLQTAATYQQSIHALSPGLDNFIEGQFLLVPLTGRPAPDEALERSVARIQSALSARAAMLGQLAQVYTSFVALASYDASGQVKSSLAGLDGSINNFATTLGATSPPISSGAAAQLTDAGGLIAAQAQKRKTLEASAAIRARLGPIIELLGTENERYQDLQAVITNGLKDTAVALLM
ncbi:MAG: hypothetical protein ACREQD_09540, partial [Candidatus Binataceae bacterium]